MKPSRSFSCYFSLTSCSSSHVYNGNIAEITLGCPLCGKSIVSWHLLDVLFVSCTAQGLHPASKRPSQYAWLHHLEQRFPAESWYGAVDTLAMAREYKRISTEVIQTAQDACAGYGFKLVSPAVPPGEFTAPS